MIKENAFVVDESLIITIYFLLKPLYLFDSGLPQLCDYFLILAAVILLIKNKFRLFIPAKVMKWSITFALMCLFQILVNTIWYTVTNSTTMLIRSIYYPFNFIAVLVCFAVYEKLGIHNVKYAMCNGCFCSVILSMIGIIVNYGTKFRATGFFNNPNQLGYYAMICLTVIALFPRVLPLWKNVIIVCGSLWACFLSLSKASIISLFVLSVLYVIFGSRNRDKWAIIRKLIVLCLIFAIVYCFLYADISFINHNRTLHNVKIRLLRVTIENDSNLGTGRGYNRIFELGYHILWGMGEGAFGRFATLTGLEVHSTFINLLVSYGLIGFFGYIYIIGSALIKKGRTIRNIACFSGILLYFLTHNGIRNTLFWMLLAVILLSNRYEETSVIPT